MVSQKIKLQINPLWSGCAQGKYLVNAKGCILSVLRWGNHNEPLYDWSPFVYIPIDPAGNGVFLFSGMRGIPSGVSRVWARCYAQNFTLYSRVTYHGFSHFLKCTSVAHRGIPA